MYRGAFRIRIPARLVPRWLFPSESRLSKGRGPGFFRLLRTVFSLIGKRYRNPFFCLISRNAGKQDHSSPSSSGRTEMREIRVPLSKVRESRKADSWKRGSDGDLSPVSRS